MIKIKLLKGCENIRECYYVTTCGRIYSVNSGKIVRMNPSDNGKGYKIARLKTIEGKSKNIYVHRLVALAFITNWESKEHVDHIDTIKENNYVNNLRWVTVTENFYNKKTLEKQLKNHNLESLETYVYDKHDNLVGVYPSTAQAVRELLGWKTSGGNIIGRWRNGYFFTREKR